ncbi:uncharacterized protein EI90DRAFT_3028811 [Cantharellus anzutake]|uniref:uncharacterized protein n=1 Tax=Cantharellus anzutake TaxID=1750568 RepID=UPI001904F066|nr:uncharacterized protein EI90DRAFT_3028811 [Cantharellus anzutake]KAF8344226.1 hypothetical protein EI90DRAFT_3028811 [Cantharellus anzutake]
MVRSPSRGHGTLHSSCIFIQQKGYCSSDTKYDPLQTSHCAAFAVFICYQPPFCRSLMHDTNI